MQPPVLRAVDYVTTALANNVVFNVFYPPFKCTSCFDCKNVDYKLSDIFSVMQSLFSIYGPLMTPTSIIFVLLIQTYSTEARKTKKASKANKAMIAQDSPESKNLLQ